jgi:hypothetical protein
MIDCAERPGHSPDHGLEAGLWPVVEGQLLERVAARFPGSRRLRWRAVPDPGGTRIAHDAGVCGVVIPIAPTRTRAGGWLGFTTEFCGCAGGRPRSAGPPDLDESFCRVPRIWRWSGFPPRPPHRRS